MEVSFNNWGEAVAFLSERTDLALEGLMALSAQQMVDQQVIAALVASHSHLHVAADTWLHVVRGLAAFRGGEQAWRAWLFTIARHRVVDEGRSLQNDQPESVREAYSERVAYWEGIFRKALPENK